MPVARGFEASHELSVITTASCGWKPTLGLATAQASPPENLHGKKVSLQCGPVTMQVWACAINTLLGRSCPWRVVFEASHAHAGELSVQSMPLMADQTTCVLSAINMACEK